MRGLAAFLVFFGCESLQSVIANGDTRTISFHHLHTGEDLTITYKREGRYDEAALQKINWLMRDWRRDEPIKMDPHLIDLVLGSAARCRRQGSDPDRLRLSCPCHQFDAARARAAASPSSASTCSARRWDFFLPDADLSKLREAGLRLQRGGVGFYPASGSPFVHMDTGNVRHWPKVSREYLAKVFPDGKTVHIPADGRPMPAISSHSPRSRRAATTT